MIELAPEVITILMLGGLLVGVLWGYHIAVVIGGIGLVVGYLVFGGQVVQILYDRTYYMLLSYSYLAVPLFIFMGFMLERSGIVEKLYDVLYLWLGGLRGGLAITTVLVGTILAACVGIIGASVTLLSIIAPPAMIKRGYSKALASGSVCAGGTLGILIPPSIMLVIYGPMAQLSVGKLFFGAFIPGFVLSALYCSYITLRSFIQPNAAPAVPIEQRAVPFVKKTTMLLIALVPPAILIMSVLGSIFFGIAPPTEAASVGAFAAALLTIAYRKFSWRVLKETALETLRISSMIMLIAIMAFAFTGVFMRSGCGEVVQNAIIAAPGGRWGAFGIIMLVIFLLGFLIDWIGIVFIMVPIITPIGVALGFDPVWFALMVCVNLQASFLTPPYAGALFYLRGAAAPELEVTMGDIIRGVIPFIVLVLIALILCIAFPQLIVWLPGQMIK